MNKQNLLIALAFFTIAILITQSFWINPVYAVEGVHSVGSMTSTELFYNGGANTYVAHTAATTTIEKISPVTFVRTTATLPAGTYNGRGDCSLTSDVCVWTTNANLIKAVKADGTSLWSVTADSSASTGAGFTDIVESLGIVLVSVTCSANSNRILQEYDLGTGTFIKNVGNCAGTALGNGINTANGFLDSATSYIITMQGAGQVGNFQIWNISPTTPTRTCSWATVTTISGTEGDIIKLGSTYYISDGTTLQALSSTCTDGTDITSASHGKSTIINLYKSTVRNEYYVEDITGFGVMNVTTPTQKLGDISCVATSATDPSIFADSFIQVACLDDTANVVTVIEIASGGGGTPQEGELCNSDLIDCSAFCEIAGNEHLLRCVAEANGGSLFVGNQTNPFNPVGGTNDIIVGAFNLSNSDIKTNGVGYILLAVALLLFNVLFLIAVMVANNRGVVVQSPIYIMAILSFAIIFAFTLAQWTDPLFLILSVIGMVALATPKIVHVVRGGFGGIVGGGSSD